MKVFELDDTAVDLVSIGSGNFAVCTASGAVVVSKYDSLLESYSLQIISVPAADPRRLIAVPDGSFLCVNAEGHLYRIDERLCVSMLGKINVKGEDILGACCMALLWWKTPEDFVLAVGDENGNVHV